MASYPTYSNEESAQQLRLNMYSLKARKSARRSHINVHTNETASLGPWPDTLPETYYQHYNHESRCPTIASRECSATFIRWQKNHQGV
jgi:uncharacterized membrane-anchored protein YhcB (DUF1043 family)